MATPEVYPQRFFKRKLRPEYGLVGPRRRRTLLVGLLRRGVEEKRIVTTRGLALARPRERVLRGESTHVYGRRTCRSCGGDVQRFLQRARTAYVCVACQPFRAE